VTGPPLFAVVLAGGRGTRFWPRSRRALPKQFLRLVGRRSLLAETLARVRPLVPASRVLLVTTGELRDAARRELPRLAPANVLLEPVGRNTAPAIALAAHAALARAKDPLLLVLPSDHFVGNPAWFRAAGRAGADFLAREPQGLVAFGVEPTRPETGYGYIRIKAETRWERIGRKGSKRPRGGPRVRRVAQFIEKPDLATAKELISKPGVYWNAGVFLWRARAFLDALAKHAPRVARPLGRAVGTSGAPAPRAYARIPAVSVDVAVLEKADHVFVVPMDVQWSDLGSWVSLAEVLGGDGNGNVVEGKHVGIGTGDSILLAPGKKLIATIGVENLIVVDTGEVLFLCRRDRAQDVRKLVADLEKRGLRRLT
jgi:mannose-1-phosphate guanylyltransferase